MRERLVASFVLLALALILVVGSVHTYRLGNDLRRRESDHLHQEAVTIAALVASRVADGGQVDRAFLEQFVHEDDQIVYVPEQGPTVAASGASYDGAGDDLSSTVRAGGGMVTIAEDDDLVRQLVVGDPWALVVLVAMTLLAAALAGLAVARWLSAPFRQLAGAAEALGRGRVDLQLPRTRVPEAAAISRSLLVGADQLRQRVGRDQEFAAHASHALRSPLTGLRLELEDLAGRDDVPADVRATAQRALDKVGRVDVVAGEIVALQRRTLVEGAEIALRDLAEQVAQRWADRLGTRGRRLTAAVDGELDQRYTPGPVEHVLDLVLEPLVTDSRGDVRLEMEGAAEGHVRIRVRAEADGPASDGADPFAEARGTTVALGGRWSGDRPVEGLEVLLPRR